MKSARFLPAQIWTISQADEKNVIYIRPEGSEKILPVYVADTDIQTILAELTHILAPGPNIHELLLSVIESLQAELKRVEFYGIRNGTYLCRIVLMQNKKEIFIESRPADILCLSACLECSIHIDDEILVHNGIPIDHISQKSSHEESSQDSPSIAIFLKKELQDALEHEEFERAAVLRDRLIELSHPI